jgi:hypothetical protein
LLVSTSVGFGTFLHPSRQPQEGKKDHSASRWDSFFALLRGRIILPEPDQHLKRGQLLGSVASMLIRIILPDPDKHLKRGQCLVVLRIRIILPDPYKHLKCGQFLVVLRIRIIFPDPDKHLKRGQFLVVLRIRIILLDPDLHFKLIDLNMVPTNLCL